MVKTYHADFAYSITSGVIVSAIGSDHLWGQEMMMTPTSRPNPSPSAAGITAWLLNLATRLLAHSLSMPEPLVHTSGVFVLAHVQAVETSIGRTLCPIRLWRRIRSWRSGLKR
jgi:hypothetical protein